MVVILVNGVNNLYNFKKGIIEGLLCEIIERRKQKSEIDIIKYHIRPRTTYSKVTNTQENVTIKRANK